jgi:NTP pyrophosphatase (non-canonical NTP hydrolase)
MERFYRMAEGSNKRFPEGAVPFQMAARLLEECGEVAKEINHWEGSGIKRQKYGEPRKEDLANEIRQSVVELFKIAAYYQVQDELEKSIDEALSRMKNEGLID